MAPKEASSTYRVRQLPSHIERYQLPAILVGAAADLGPPENIQVHSLALSLSPWENPPSRIATVTFKKVPASFDDGRREWTLQTAHMGLSKNIIIDVHFLDFTPLNDPDPNRHALDCIAISGLASHPFGSWKQRDSDSNFMWLRDALPRDITRIRSIIYGYDTSLVMSESFQTVEDIAITFIARLKSIGRTSFTAKPIVFLAHSLGGILLKQALVEMASRGEMENFIFSTTREIMFFGTPNRGMHMRHLLPMVKGQPNASLVKLLSPTSVYISQLDEQFSGLALIRDVRILSFYETKQSHTTLQTPSGLWERTGPLEVLVDKDSAVLKSAHPSDIHALNANHSDMVKFGEDDPDYKVIAANLYDLSESLSERNVNSKPLRFAVRQPESKAEIFDISQRREQGLSVFLKRHKDQQENVLNSAQALALTAATKYKDEDQPPASSRRRITPVEQEAILKSLQISDTRQHIRRIESAYASTFEWLWVEDSVAFPSWLNRGNGAYWISGKPGSGKTTIMKYIYDHSRAMVAKSGRKQIHAGFFFHDRGSQMQKSFEGLLYSILHEILVSENSLLHEILPIYLARPPLQRSRWPLADLKDAFNRVLEQSDLPIDLLLFVDALDEYEGPPEAIADFIQSLTNPPEGTATRVKICFSSRPWNAFELNFRDCPGFRIHEHTQRDILEFINGKLSEGAGTNQPFDPDAQLGPSLILDLASKIVSRAEGMFLWVKLVVDEVLNAHADGATPQELIKIIDSLPEGLEALYERIISKIVPSCRRESFAILEIVLRSDRRISLGDLQAAVECSFGLNLDECIAKIPKDTSEPINLPQFQRRLRSRCGGLVEVVGVGSNPVVQFMHQTVKDFVTQTGFRQRILPMDPSESAENGHSFLAKYGMARLVSEWRKLPGHPPNGPLSPAMLRNFDTWFEFIMHATQAELTTGKSLKVYIDGAGRRPFQYIGEILEARRGVEVNRCFNSALSFAVMTNLLKYVREKLDETPAVNANPGKSLLHYAVESVKLFNPQKVSQGSYDGYEDLYQSRNILSPPRGLYDRSRDPSQMVELLLEYGADSKATYEEVTPFEKLFTHCVANTSGVYDARRSVINEGIVNVTRVLLQHDQDPNIDIRVRDDWAPKTYRLCKPLHVASAELAQVLIEHGADVNALDEDGCTPLDIKVGAGKQWYPVGFSGDPIDLYKTAMLLVLNKARLTRSGVYKAEHFLGSLARHIEDIDERLMDLPNLRISEAEDSNAAESSEEGPATPGESREGLWSIVRRFF